MARNELDENINVYLTKKTRRFIEIQFNMLLIVYSLDIQACYKDLLTKEIEATKSK